MKPLRFAALFMVLFCTCAFSSQPLSERKAQELLPQSKDSMWKTFAACKVKLDPKEFTYSITLTPQVKAMNGKPFTISGFMLPLEPTEKFRHFLLSRRTPTCPFCPPGEPDEIVEVFSKQPMQWEESLVTMSGTMVLVNDPSKGLFFQMQAAVAIKK